MSPSETVKLMVSSCGVPQRFIASDTHVLRRHAALDHPATLHSAQAARLIPSAD